MATTTTGTTTLSSPVRRGVKIAGVSAAAILAMTGLWYLLPSGGDGIEEGKKYALAYSYRVYVKETAESKTVEEGRAFDFSDRNIPRSGITIPISDGRNLLARENQTLPPSTARKIRERVRPRTWEGVEYPGYEYVVWEYNFAHVTNQTHIPTVVLKKD